ncbi:NADPH-dependent FMN reductase [Halomonas organivorans]|uniref:NAD(P)H-dependent FMN reductase n=1 Tax=Halomonas organivorans TaxID=257772 RepID=A0A7W5C0Y4_9GAMM|nr:NAD(P)H-dependent oxidoreductase [Halomonas organivorans]MBB3142344.1 NAD(P)H-dependent FMN reductase [Halomonas organivorans]
MQETLRIAVIYGSVRDGRMADTVVNWVKHRLGEWPGFTVDVIDPAGRDADDQGAHDHRLDAADGFIVVTPEYNHSFPGALKSLIDSHFWEWQAKPVAFVSYGAASGGIRAVEQLRGVFAELHAVGLRDAVMLPNVWNQFDQDGALLEADMSARAMRTLLARLQWWANALADARRTHAYQEVVT